jgi:uncharacterized membrane protein YphA (DoxX/SURF4 family)
MFIALSLLFATVCLVPGSAKVLGVPRMRNAAAHFRIPWRGYQLIGTAELAAAAGALTGLWYRPLGIAAAVGMILLLTGALAAHRRAGDAAKEAAAALLALAITIAYLTVALAS